MRIAPILTTAFVLFGAATASAQQTTAPAKLATGTWTGTITPPNGERATVTYDVTTKNDTLGITINAGQFGTFVAEAVKLNGDILTFAFTPGPRVSCKLAKQTDGSYSGDCLDEMGGAAQAVMQPPKPASGTN